MIYVGCDHGGYALKRELLKYLSEEGFPFTDLGCGGETVDYPDIAEAVCKKVLESEENRGVLLCGTGVGISIAANKIKGIRAALCGDWYSAKYTRLHNDANVICMGGRTTGPGLAAEILDVFLHTSFEGGKHAARVNKIKKLEE